MSEEETVTGAGREPDPGAPGLGVPERFGAYRILRKLGEGGMSVVYLAVRDDDEFRKRVAIKVIQPVLRTDGMIHRFRRERQILASLEHENIARLLDGGTTEGAPYFVMEYVEGQPIDRYCEARKLSIEERLQLFRAVCAAVQFAHQNLVVHRDIKPSNILVTAAGVPKLMDFGIAKLLNPELAADEGAPTRFDARVMTPEYASPEQIRGEPITTSSDVYSLGVLLFELLTGQKPYAVAHRSLDEISRAITETAPPRPSAVVPDRAGRRLSGDLDNIVLMALRKEPQRRYASAQQLADDIGRHLQRLPVVAGRDTVAYRAGKFLKRHRWGVAAAALFVALLIAFASAMTVQSFRLAAERDRSEAARRSAESETAKAQAINTFLRELLGSAGPFEGLRRDVTVVEALTAAEAKARETLAHEPEVQAGVLNAIGGAYYQLGRMDDGERLIRAGLDIRRGLPGQPTAGLADSLLEIGRLLEDRGKFPEAEAALREALAIRRSLFGEESLPAAVATTAIAETLMGAGRLAEAEQEYRKSLATRRRVLGDESVEVSMALTDLGVLLDVKTDFHGAVEALEDAAARQRRLLPPGHPELGTTLSSLGIAIMHTGDLRAAEAPLRESLTIRRKNLGSDHPDVAQSLNNLAGLYRRRGDLDAAEPMYRECIRILRVNFGSEHPHLASTLANLATVERDRGNLDAAEALVRESIPMQRKFRGPDHPLLANDLGLLASILEKRGNYTGAAPLREEAVAVYERGVGVDSPRTATIRLDYAHGLIRLKRLPAAEDQLRAAHDALTRAERSEENDRRRRAGLKRLAELYDSFGKRAEASACRAELAKLDPGGASGR